MRNACRRIAAVLSCAAALAASTGGRAQTDGFVPVTDAILAHPDPADWLMVNRTLDQQRFSPLIQIDTSNVGQLRLAWSRGLPDGTQESTPLVYRGVMYVIAPGAIIQALDATNGDLIWQYERDYDDSASAKLSRFKNLGIYGDMIYFGAPDGYLVALDAKTGKLRWETKVDAGGITAGGVLVADGKVITNRECQSREPLVRDACFIAAHDAVTGKELWKFYTTAAPGEPGGDAWGNLPASQRVAGPWGLPGSYDPARKTLYWGVANPVPYTRLKRHGRADAISLQAPADPYSNSTVALDINTGKLRWYYQELPGDDWDTDHNHERILIHTRIHPDPKNAKWISSSLGPDRERDIVLTVAEGGDIFVIERDGGKFLWANPFPYDNPDLSMDQVDPKTGKTRANPAKIFQKDGDKTFACYYNTRSLWSIAYSPLTNAVYVPFNDQCMRMTANTSAESGYSGRTGVPRPGADPQKFMGLAKVNVATGEMRVLYSQPQPTNGSALTTAGNLVFFGDLNRRLRALDSTSGKLLWEQVVGGMIMASTITYAVNGKQYVMIFTGDGQFVTSGPLALTTKAMPPVVHNHSAIYVFALP